MRSALLALFVSFCYAAPPSARECQLCQLVVTNIKSWYAKHGPTSADVFREELIRECDSLSSSSDTELCKGFAECQYKKIHGDVHHKSATPDRTCIDIGSCGGPLSSTSFRIVDWTDKTSDYNKRCVAVMFLVLHHTVTKSAKETLAVLQHRGLSVQYIFERNGTAYQMVHDYWRAWHAGASRWGTHSDLNTYSVGIEIVNTGDEAFPAKQMEELVKLCEMLVKRWHINEHDIVAHGDIQPESKDDPSGWFDWKYLYKGLGMFKGVFDSSLTQTEKETVLMDSDSYESAKLKKVQEDLSIFGYQQSLGESDGIYGERTRHVIQAFNRHWCPEVFIKEKVNHRTNDTEWNPKNERWYRLSQERLEHLVTHA